MRTDSVRKVSWPFFRFPFSYFWKNIGDIVPFFRARKTLLKDGIPPQAYWETYYWFIDVMETILKWYRNERSGTPMVIIKNWNEEKEWDKENEKAYNALLDEMLLHLEGMKEENYDIDLNEPDKWRDIEKEKNSHKDAFFKLFAEHFFTFWD